MSQPTPQGNDKPDTDQDQPPVTDNADANVPVEANPAAQVPKTERKTRAAKPDNGNGNGTRSKPLHNFTGFERHAFRENAHFSSIFKYHPHKSKLLHQQPIEFIRLTLGQQCIKMFIFVSMNAGRNKKPNACLR